MDQHSDLILNLFLHVFLRVNGYYVFVSDLLFSYPELSVSLKFWKSSTIWNLIAVNCIPTQK